MNKFARFSQIFGLIIFSFIFLNQTVAAQVSPDDAQAEKLSALAGGGVGGAWKLNSAESDDPLQKMQELLQNTAGAPKAPETSNVKQQQLPPLTTSLFHPDSLILADGGGDRQITINENFKEIVQTRTVFADGRTRAFELSPGASYTVNALKEGDKLTVETISPRGNKMIETYATEAGGKKLKVTIRVENPQSKELITLHRTYDRTMIDLFEAGGDEMQ